MTLTIRSFRNTDVGPLCDVWNAHHAELGPECAIDPLRLELSCLSKPYFNESELLVAERDDVVLGMTHIAPCSNADLSDAEPDSASVAALCVVPCESEFDIAAALLACVDDACQQRGATRCAFRPMLPNISFYLGSGVAGSMIGATAREQRTCQWLKACGYTPTIPTNAWELDLAGFHPPVDRIQMQVRRSAQVNREVDEPLLPWWQACVLGHTEPSAFQLTHRIEKRVLHEVLFWSVAGELANGPESAVWLWPPRLDESQPENFDTLLFLLAESLREFRDERLDTAYAFSAAHDTRLNELYRRLGFSASTNGVIFEKKFVDAQAN